MFSLGFFFAYFDLRAVCGFHKNKNNPLEEMISKNSNTLQRKERSDPFFARRTFLSVYKVRVCVSIFFLASLTSFEYEIRKKLWFLVWSL